MRVWVFAVIPLVLAGLIAAEFVSAPSTNSTRAMLAALRSDLRFTYHQCVPLGWAPVEVSGTYYPGYTASAANYAEWLDALWRGHIDRTDLRSPQARSVYETLNHLSAAGLLVRQPTPAGFDYFLTPRAIPYYYDSSSFRNNRDSLTYLCYSTIVPNRINWMHQLAVKRSHGTDRWYTLQFSWTASGSPRWAQDPFLQAHSVVLAPTTSPTTARMVLRDDRWYVSNIYDRGWMLPALTISRCAPGAAPGPPASIAFGAKTVRCK